MLDVYRRTDRVPPLGVVDRLGEAATEHSAAVRRSLDALLEHLRAAARSATAGDVDALARLEQMRRVFGPEPGAGATGEWPLPS